MPANLAPALCLLVPLYGNLGANFIICRQIANTVLFLWTVLQACANASQSRRPRRPRRPQAAEPEPGWFPRGQSAARVTGVCCFLSRSASQECTSFLGSRRAQLRAQRTGFLPGRRGWCFRPIVPEWEPLFPRARAGGRGGWPCLSPGPGRCCCTAVLWLGMRYQGFVILNMDEVEISQL